MTVGAAGDVTPRPSATQVQPRRAVAATQPAAEANNLPAASTPRASHIASSTAAAAAPPPAAHPRSVITRGTSSVSAKYTASVNAMLLMIHVFVARNSPLFSPLPPSLPAQAPPQALFSARQLRRAEESVSLRHSPSPPAAATITLTASRANCTTKHRSIALQWRTNTCLIALLPPFPLPFLIPLPSPALQRGWGA